MKQLKYSVSSIYCFLLIFIFCMPLEARYRNIKKSRTQQDVSIMHTQELLEGKGDVALVEKNIQNDDPVTHASMHDIVCKPDHPSCPAKAVDDEKNLIEINLDNTDLQNVLKWISETFDVSFLPEDAIQPLVQGAKALGGNKISFKTHRPMTKKEVWDLFLSFLELFGFGLVNSSVKDVYKIRQTAVNTPNSINRSPLDSYINVDWKELPNNDTHIRYIYFIRNTSLDTIQSFVESYRSVNGVFKPLKDLNAFSLTDRASNVRTIMEVVDTLDQVTSPEAMSVLRLKNADAKDIVDIYTRLTKAEDPMGLAARLTGAKKPTNVYFPENIRLIADQRSNSLIILGDADGIKKIEDFIIKHVDTELKIPYSPLYVYDLQYAKADDMAKIMAEVTKFAPTSPAAAYGGVREGDKYLQPMTFTSEKAGNRLLIKAEKEDYLKVRDIIKKLDVRQPQIVIEVLIVNVIATDNRELGVQIRNKDFNTVSKNLDFQVSGLPFGPGTKAAPIVQETPPNEGSLVTNLIRLAQNQTPGATLVSIANAANGVWALFKILQSQVQANIISNPFLITTNKYQAQTSIGETRRVPTAIVNGTQSTQAFDDVSANLTVKITPQINSIGIINLDIDISIDNFTEADSTSISSANQAQKTIKTNADVGNRQVLALGGLLRNNFDEMYTKVPILGDIPLIGWFFKSKTKTKTKDNLIVFISPRIVEPIIDGGVSAHTQEKINMSKEMLCELHSPAERRDPVHRWFFKDRVTENHEFINEFVAGNIPAPPCLDIPDSLYCEGSCIDKSACDVCFDENLNDIPTELSDKQQSMQTFSKINEKSILAVLPADQAQGAAS